MTNGVGVASLLWRSADGTGDGNSEQEQSGMLNISVLTDADVSQSGALVAPTSIWLEAFPVGLGIDPVALPPTDYASTPSSSDAAVYDPTFHEIHYSWTVTRPSGAQTSFSNAPNIPDVWNDRNIAFGKRVAFCFDEPGDYVVTCSAKGPNGPPVEDSVTFSNAGGDYPAVVDSDSAYPGQSTMCINPAGDDNFDWAPAGAIAYSSGANDIAVLDSALSTFHGSANRRLLFKPGAIYDFSDRGSAPVIQIPSFENKSRIYIGGGNGAQPILNCGTATRFIDVGFRNLNFESVTLTNLDLRSDWDATHEVGLAGGRSIAPDAASHYTIHKIKTSGWTVNLASPGTGSQNYPLDRLEDVKIFPTRVLYSECDSTSWKGFGIYVYRVGPGKIGFVGLKNYQSPTAINVNGGRPLLNNSGPTRFNHMETIYVGASDIFANNGLGAHQNPIRFHNGYNKNEQTRFDWSFINIERIVLEGGAGPMGIASQDPDYFVGKRSPCNYVIDKALVVGTPWTLALGGDSNSGLAGGGTWRNIMFVVPGTASLAPMHKVFDWGKTPIGDDSRLNFEQPVAVHNLTVVNLRTTNENADIGAITPNVGEYADFTDFTFENNVFHWPNLDTSIDGNLDTGATWAGFQPRYQGRNDPFALIPLTLANVAVGGAFEVPYTAIPQTTQEGRAAGQVDQTYYLDNPSHNFHYLVVGNKAKTVPEGSLHVEALTDRLRFTNFTDGTLDGSYQMYIDRRGVHPGPDTSTQTPANLPVLWAHQGTSSGQGIFANDDLLLRPRTDPKSAGAIELIV